MRGVAPSSVVATMRLTLGGVDKYGKGQCFSIFGRVFLLEAGFSGLLQLRLKSQSGERDLDASY